MKSRLAVGVLLIVAGIVSALLLSVPRFVNLKDTVEAFPRAPLSGGVVELERGTHDVYLDVPAGTGAAGWTMSLNDAAGRDLELQPSSSNVEYAFGDREGNRIGKVRVTAPGRHTVRGTGPPGARVIFGQDTLRGLGRAIVFAVLAFVVLAGAGVILIVVALARRRPRDAPTWP